MNILDTNVQYVKGVGPYIAGLLSNLGIVKASDLLYHFPFRYIDRRNITTIKDSVPTPGVETVIIANVVTSGISFLGKKRKRIFELIATDKTGMVSAKWFNFHQKYMVGRFKKDMRLFIAGEMTEYNGVKQFVHPEVEILDESDSIESAGRLIPIYPSTEGLSQKILRKVIKNTLEKYLSSIVNPFSSELMEKYHLTDLREAVLFLHNPPSDADIEILNGGRTSQQRTIIFKEFFVFELALAMKRARLSKEKGILFKIDEDLHKKFLGSLPFELTDAQKRVLGEIFQDMKRGNPMNRLLQGDVGSGKTVVALASAVQAVNNGYQVAFMAPTEILAEQHFKTMAVTAEKMEIPCALLTANVKGAHRDAIYEGVSEGKIPIVIGTHALIQSEVKFKKLGFAIIDEQHRFGVLQRQALNKKGINPDILVMTATPIPRTLAMTLYGDLEVSIIDQLPAGRKPIYTKVYMENEREKLYGGIRMELDREHQVYVVYPLIEESEKIDLKNATDMSKELASVFSPKYRVELLHGKMKPDEKERIMREFKEGKVHVLAATSVVEVGVDVPNATVMVVEHAERFGLAALHQLRGRVGRSDKQSFCILLCAFQPTEDAYRRLNIMVETTDGFRIAEEDLSIRGPGEFLGTRQSGVPEFKVANLVRDVGILQLARQAAFEVIAEDAGLKLPKNKLFNEILKEKVEYGNVA